MEADFLYLNGPLCPSNSPATKISRNSEPVRRLWFEVLLLVGASDLLFYGQRAGLSIAIMGALLLAVLIWNRRAMRWDLPRAAGLLLLLATIGQAAVATGLANAVVLICLLSAAMIDGEAEKIGLRAAVLPLALAAWLRSLVRWADFFQASAGVFDWAARPGAGRSATRVLRMVVPGLAVLLPFWLLFFNGNAMMAKNFSDAFDVLATWIRWLHLPTAGRFVFWLLSATAALTFLWPKAAEDAIRLLSRP
jgi:hypothetical protein